MRCRIFQFNKGITNFILILNITKQHLMQHTEFYQNQQSERGCHINCDIFRPEGVV